MLFDFIVFTVLRVYLFYAMLVFVMPFIISIHYGVLKDKRKFMIPFLVLGASFSFYEIHNYLFAIF